MTQSQNIAVLGAGIMGLCSAYALARAGHKITLYDPKGFPAADNASAMAGGMLAPYSEIEHMPPAWIEAGLAGIAWWQANFPALVRQNGSLLIAHDEDRYILERFKTHLPTPLQTNHRPQEVEPTLPGKFQTGIFLEEEAHLDPARTLLELCEHIKKLGGSLIQEAAAPEKLTAKYDQIIDCRGLAAPDKNLRGVKGEITLVQNEEFKLTRPVRLMHPRYPLYIVPRANHVFMIGATVIEAEDDTISLRSGLELLSALYSIHPSFGEAKILELKAGIRPSYADNLPKIKFDTMRSVINCNGLFRHGYLLAPIMAEALAAHLAGQDNIFLNLMTGAQNEDCTNHPQRRRKELRSAA